MVVSLKPVRAQFFFQKDIREELMWPFLFPKLHVTCFMIVISAVHTGIVYTLSETLGFALSERKAKTCFISVCYFWKVNCFNCCCKYISDNFSVYQR